MYEEVELLYGGRHFVSNLFYELNLRDAIKCKSNVNKDGR